MGSPDLKLDIEFLKFMKFKNGAECLRCVLGAMLWSLEWYVFLFSLFLFPQLFDALFNFLRRRIRTFSAFFGGVGYLLYLRYLYKFVCSFLYIFRFLMSVRASLLKKYVCLYRDILIVSPGFHVFHKFYVSLFAQRHITDNLWRLALTKTTLGNHRKWALK